MKWKTFLQSEDGMKWKTFLQIVLLMIVAAVIFYVVYPKYYWKTTRVRGNKITGGTWLLTEGEGKIMARLADPDEPHTCQLSEVFLAYDPKYKKLPEEFFYREIQIKDIFRGVLMNKTSFDLSSEEGKNELVKELVDRVNRIIREGQIETIYMEMMVQ